MERKAIDPGAMGLRRDDSEGVRFLPATREIDYVLRLRVSVVDLSGTQTNVWVDWSERSTNLCRSANEIDPGSNRCHGKGHEPDEGCRNNRSLALTRASLPNGMNPSVPSRTALGVARRRAAHQSLDRPLIFRDPLAERLAGVLEPVWPSRTPHPNSRSSRLLRAFIAARSRYAEDQLALFFTRGVRQYVVLGAGLDTFAYRNPYAPELRVFEADHPATQAWKLERLHAAGIAVPDSLRFVPVDFEQQRLAEVLQTTAGFDIAHTAFFSLLGVTPYLTMDALVTTLAAIASMPAGSGVVFDYAVPVDSLSLWERIGVTSLSARVARIGEAFRLFLDPGELSRLLGDLGFASIEDLGRGEINTRYFQQRSDGLQIGSAAGRILRAAVAPRK